tara:strand:+ start:2478 stop:2876 length:399 start_codon:yes stop_codon:yes gene_type:complete
MKYIIPHKINLSDIEIIESKTIFKIKIINNPIHIFGIILKLNDIVIQKNHNQYYLILNQQNYNLVNQYDTYLSEQLTNYNKIIQKINNQNVIVINSNKLIQKYYLNNSTSIYINIKYVKKDRFLNNPIINII